MTTEKECIETIKGENIYIVYLGNYEVDNVVCPECKRPTSFAMQRYETRDCETDKLLSKDIDGYCGYGCEVFDDKGLKPHLNKSLLKRNIMASRVRVIGDSLEVYNESENPYLHGFNCLYIHWQLLPSGEYSVFYDYYLEHGYQGRDKEVGKKEMQSSKKKPTSKEAKELLYAWMVERFEAMTSK